MSGARWRIATAVAATAGAFAVSGAFAGAAVRHGGQASAARAELIAGALPHKSLTTCAGVLGRPAHCYSPQVLQTAYGVIPLLDRGVNGRGVTVVLPEESISASDARRLPAHEGIFLRQSIRAYDRDFGLAALRLRFDTKLAPGAPTNYPSTGLEELQDVELVHEIAPGATIDVELVAGDGPVGRLPEVIDEGSKDGKVISFSYGISENAVKPQLGKIHAALARADAHGVSVFASAGDLLDMAPFGVRGVNMPAADPLVTAVGGTALSVNPSNGTYADETVWKQQEQELGSGGGFSDISARPSYQVGVPGIDTHRGVPDVAFNASPSDGVEIVDYAEGEACAKHRVSARAAAKLHCVQTTTADGTSESTPGWAGIAALADQYAHHPLGLLNPTIYRIGESSSYSRAFHDITTGNNTAMYKGKTIVGYSATAGWDPVTGWGSPNAQALVPLLAHGG